MGPDAIWPFIFYRVHRRRGRRPRVGDRADVRGRVRAAARCVASSGAYQQIAIAGGIAIVLFVNWGIALQGDDVWVLETGWRYMMVSLAVPALAFFWLSFRCRRSRAGW